MSIELALSRPSYDRLRTHLLPRPPSAEEAAFVFARRHPEDDSRLVEVVTRLVPREGFRHRSLFHLELTDAMRAAIIKEAHDLGASIIEFHSHPTQSVARFSPSDRAGLREFAPHVLWRLKERPFGAVVVAPASFDSLAWTLAEGHPVGLVLHLDDGSILRPTGRTLDTWEDETDE